MHVSELPLNGSGALLSPNQHQMTRLREGPPILIVAVDTEAEFDWNVPFARTQTSVRNLRNQVLAQRIFDGFGVRPIYLVDYAVANQTEGYMPIREILEAGRCEIGAHLHPWITPPFDEELNDRNSYSHNLPTRLQREKLARLTDAITSSLGVRPVAYRAGRYGIGEDIAEIMEALGYQIDLSVQPGLDMRRVYGPDFRQALDAPYWFGSKGRLLEIPLTYSFTGLIAHPAVPKSLSVELYRQIAKPGLNRMRSLGIFARLRLLERIPLTPEGVTLRELRRLTHALLARGRRVFVFSYHSSSLLPGNTQYVRSSAELSQFLNTIAAFLEFFVNEIGGITMTPGELRAMVLKDAASSISTVPTSQCGAVVEGPPERASSL